METVDYQSVIPVHDINRMPISVTTTAVNLTGSWRFARPQATEKISPCSVGCPASTNIPRYIFHILNGDLETAAHTLRGENPLPAICGRVCPHFCESHCNRAEYDGSVQIHQIERFVGDYALNIPFEKPERLLNKRVAIVGSGPAGLSCAYFLAREGYNVTIFEKEPFAGGLLLLGIPSFRLPRDIAKREIDNILAFDNIELKTSHPIDLQQLEMLLKDYDAVFFAAGLQAERVPDNISPDNERILSGYELLKRLNVNETQPDTYKGERIAVIGGGNVAFDVARTLLRLGSEVDIIYRRTLPEAPSFEDEKHEGIEEGITFKERRIITGVEKTSRLKVEISEVLRIENGRAITTNRRWYDEYDKIVLATGQRRAFEIPQAENLFSGGDYAYGAKTVVEAIASGKQSAYRIMAFLENGVEPEILQENFFRIQKDYDRYEIVGFDKINTFYFPKQQPLEQEKLPANTRKSSFDEINRKASLEQILDEARRCFSCGVCNLCKTCWFVCPDICVSVADNVRFDYDYCKGCALCSAECPRGVIEMVEDK